MNNLCRPSRNNQGAMIAEAGATMALMLPILIVVIFVGLEASYAYLIKSSLSEGAREAARSLAIDYGLDPAIASSRSAQDAQVFNNIRINNIINNSQQFDNPVFNTASNPPTVSVNVRYTSNQYGLPQFPNPDPLNLKNTLVIAGTATYRL